MSRDSVDEKELEARATAEQTSPSSSSTTSIPDPEKAEPLASSPGQQTQDAPPAPVNPWMDPASFPDGGTEAWLTVAASSACFFVSWYELFSH